MALVTTRPGMPRITSKYASMRIEANIEAMAGKHGVEALDTLVKCMRDTDAPWPARTKASETILSYAYGKPVDRVQVMTLDGGTSADPVRLTTEQLIAALSRTLPPPGDTDVLEHSQPEPVAQGDIPPA